MILLLITRTVLLGAILFLPVGLNILIIDLTIMPKNMGTAFTLRLGFYIFLDGLLFFHYRKEILAVLQKSTENKKPKFKHQFWTLILIPLFTIFLEILPAVP